MAAATESSSAVPNGTGSKTSIERVGSIPIVSDTIQTVNSVIQKNSYSSAAYDKASAVASQVYKTAEPYTKSLEPSFKAVDDLANRGLDFVQARVPYVFEANSDKMIGDATKPANDAAAAARARLNPIVEQFSSQLQTAQTNLHGVQDRLANVVAGLPRSPQEAHAAASNAASSLLAEVERIRDNVAAHAKDLPSQLQSLAHNLLDHLSQGASEIRAELGRSDAKAIERAQNVLRIAQEHASPVINDALSKARGFVGESKTDQAADAAKDTADSAKQTAKDASSSAEKTVKDASGSAQSAAKDASGSDAAQKAKKSAKDAKKETKKAVNGSS